MLDLPKGVKYCEMVRCLVLQDLEAEALGILSGHFTVDLSECLYISWEVDLDDSVQLLISVIFHQR